jgi:uncharacterized membrane protein YhhN
LILISASLYLKAEYGNATNIQKYIFKPLTTLLIILIAIFQFPEVSSQYKYYILTGLVFSVLGDIFLMLPTDRFISGLLSFLIAHIFYITAFVSDSSWHLDFIYLIPAGIYIIVFLWILIPHAGKIKIPVIIYSLTLMFLLWQASGRVGFDITHSAVLSLVGIIIFIISDSILAYNRFVQKFKAAQFLTMSTYYLAQFLIALSI